MKSDTLFIVGAIGIGAYFIYEAVQKAVAVREKLQNVGEAIGSGLFDFFHPDPVGETTFYIPTFPDGTRHSVPSRSVNSRGQFILTQFYGSQVWQLLTSKSDGKRYAAKV